MDSPEGVVNVRKYKPEKPPTQTVKIELDLFEESESPKQPAKALSVEEELGAMIGEIVGSVKEALKAHTACFAWASASKKKFYFAHKESSAQGVAPERWQSFGSDAVTQVFQAKNGQLYTEISPDDEPKLLRYYTELQGAKSFMGVPVFHREQIYAVLFADSLNKNAFGQTDVKLLNRFGKICSALIDNYAVKSGHLESIRFVEPAMGFVHQLWSGRDLEGELDEFCNALLSVVEVEHLTLALINSRSDLALRKVRTKSSYVEEAMLIDIENSAVGQAVARCESGAIDDLAALNGLPRFYQGEPNLDQNQGSMLILPIQLGDLTAGVVTLESVQKNFFQRENAQKIRFFVETLSLALHQRLLKDRIKQVSAIDEETGVFTRKTFLERARFEINRITRERGEMVLLLIEFDDPKGLEIRSNNSAMAILNLLRSTARMISANARNYDLIGRVGRMRFAVCLNGISEMNARFWAEKVREQVINFPFETDDQFRTILATVSIGLAKLRHEHADLELWLEGAEKALAHAQASGGNTVKVF